MLVAWTTTLMRQPGVDAAAVSIWGGQMAPEHVTIGLSKSRANGRSTGCSLGARMLPAAQGHTWCCTVHRDAMKR